MRVFKSRLFAKAFALGSWAVVVWASVPTTKAGESSSDFTSLLSSKLIVTTHLKACMILRVQAARGPMYCKPSPVSQQRSSQVAAIPKQLHPAEKIGVRRTGYSRMTEADIQLPIAAPDIRTELEIIDGFAIEDTRVRLLF